MSTTPFYEKNRPWVSFFIYLGSIALCSLAIGFITDMIYYGIGVKADAMAGQVVKIFPNYVEFDGAVILATLLVLAIMKECRQRGGNSCC